MQRIIEGLFGGGKLTEAQLGVAQFQPAIQGIALVQGEGGQFVARGFRLVLFQQEAAEIVMHGDEIMIELQRLAVGVNGFNRLAGMMQRQAQIVPGLGVGAQKGSRQLEFFNRRAIFPLFDQTLSLKQGARPGRGATGRPREDKGEPETTQAAVE